MSTTASAPIGVFDSGVGGLSVLQHIRIELPAEDLLYVADSGFAPYGEKSPEWIVERCLALGAFLADRGAKAVVVACNTATAAAAATLRAHLPLPVVAMEPAVKPAVAATRRGTVGVLATTGTLRSARFAALLDTWGKDVQVITQPCPGLVECVEQGALDTPHTRALVARYLAPLLTAGADAIVLGCTHYPFLRPLVEEMAGPGVAVIDTGAAVARQLRRRLDEAALLAPEGRAGDEAFWSSGEPAQAQRTLQVLWRAGARSSPLPV